MAGPTRARLAGIAIVLAVLATWAPAVASPPGGWQAPAPDFVDHAKDAGLDFTCTHWNKPLGLAPRWFIDTLHCVSPVVADFNGDGYPDLYFSNQRYDYSDLNAQFDPQDALYLNNGDGTFSDVTKLVGIHDGGYSYGAAAVDLNNDGNLDLYITAYPEAPAGFNGLNGPATVVYINHGDGTFAPADPVAMGLGTDLRFGVPNHQFGMAVAVGDLDRDGCVDLVRGNYIQYRMPFGMPGSLQMTTPDTNKVYRGHCDGTFTDVTTDSRAGLVAGRTFGVSLADLNNDGWPDITVANDETLNEVYLNNHDGTFTDATLTSGIAGPRGSMCIEAQDFNGDGNADLYMTKYEDELGQYFLGKGDGSFTNAQGLGDLPRTRNYLGWACPAFDMENDGDLDLFIANGHMNPSGGEFDHPDDPLEDNGYELPNFLFQNTLRDTGQHSWTDVSKSAGPGLLDRYVTGGAVAADFDLDGKMSIVAVNDNTVPVSYYKNDAQGLGHWLDVSLRGTSSNGFGLGARVAVTGGGFTQVQQMLSGDTLGSASVAPLHFGFGGDASPATVIVDWPSGQHQVVTVPVDMPVRIVEGQGVQMDTLAPRVDASLQGAQGAEGWFTSPSVAVSLAAQDRGVGEVSGLASLRYRVDNGPVQDYAGPFAITGEGKHTLTTFASDNAGNRAWYVREVKVDSVAPTMGLDQPLQGKLYVQDRLVGDSPTGETTIVAPVRTPDSTLTQADALAAGEEKSLKDEFGVAAPPPPATVAGALAGTIGSDGLTDIALSCADATSGAARAEFRLDGQLLFTDTALPFVWSANLRGVPVGEHRIDATVYDRAGWPSSASIKLLVVPSTTDGALNTLMLGPSLPGGN